MARLVHGRRIASDESTVRYEYAIDQDVTWAGVLTIDRADPRRWWVDGPERRPAAAAAIAHKARRRFESAGTWPERFSFQA